MKKWEQHVKKFLLLTLLVLTTCLAAPAVCHADEAEASEKIDWDSYEEISSGSCGKKVNYTVYKTGEDTYTLRLYGTGKMYNFFIAHNTYERPWLAEEVGEAYEGKEAPGYENFTQIVVEEGITNIGTAAFAYLSNPSLKVSLPSTLKEIRRYAFRDCGMAEISIPDSVTTIGDAAFMYCSNIREVRLPDSLSSLGTNAFSEAEHLLTVTNWNERLTEIPASLFAGTDLIDFEIPDYVTKIGMWAFAYTLMQDVVIPDSVTTIESSAFYKCCNLRSVTFSKNVTGAISAQCFYGCTRLNTVVMSDKITSVNAYAFSGCSSLEHVTFSKKLKTIKANAFEGCNLPFATLPDTLTSIGANAFKNNYHMDIVNLGSNVTTIKKSAFSGCKNLDLIRVPKSQYKRYKKLLKEPLAKLGNVKIEKLKK
jgi:hypothetical protein